MAAGGQFDDDFVRRYGILPLRVPEGIGIAVDCIGGFAIFTGGFLTVRFDEFQTNTSTKAGSSQAATVLWALRRILAQNRTFPSNMGARRLAKKVFHLDGICPTPFPIIKSKKLELCPNMEK